MLKSPVSCRKSRYFTGCHEKYYETSNSTCYVTPPSHHKCVSQSVQLPLPHGKRKEKKPGFSYLRTKTKSDQGTSRSFSCSNVDQSNLLLPAKSFDGSCDISQKKKKKISASRRSELIRKARNKHNIDYTMSRSMTRRRTPVSKQQYASSLSTRVDRKWHEHTVRSLSDTSMKKIGSILMAKTLLVSDMILNTPCVPLPLLEFPDDSLSDDSISHLQPNVQCLSFPPDKKVRVEKRCLKDTVLYHDDEVINQSNLSYSIVLGSNTDNKSHHPSVLTENQLESIQLFLPLSICESRFWLKYSSVRDGASLRKLLSTIRGSNRVVIAIETVTGDIFGSFTSSVWQTSKDYYGSREAFLWKFKQSNKSHTHDNQIRSRRKLEVFPWANCNDYIQLCTTNKICIGGGEWSQKNTAWEEKDTGPGITIDCDLQHGTSSSSPTFANCPLSDSGFTFEIANVDVWAITPCFNVDDAEKLESRTSLMY